MAESERRFKIGYALAPKKQRSFIQPSLTNLATQKGMDLIKIDLEMPLVDQGPFDCVLHKCYGQDWKKQLELFLFRNPNVVILDSPDAIERLHNRISMLQAVSELEMECQNVIKTASFGIPKQVVVYDNQAILNHKDWGEGLNFPVIAKPLVADGSAKSHKMRLIYNHEGLKKLKPPIVLQQFVNHGGVIFKVFVVGEYVRCVKRMSLPDVSKEKLESLEGEGEGSLSFSQVSNLTNHDKIGEKYCKMMDLEGAEMPPMCLITEIAHGLRRAIKLNLFNFDVIRDTRVGNRYLVIDINYFPGYAKMPSYETVLTDFFWDVLNNKEVGLDSRVVGNNGCGELPRKSLLDRS